MSVLNYLSPFVLGLIEPGILFFFAVQAYVQVLFDTVYLYRSISDLRAVRSKAFGKFWGKVTTPPDPPAPLVGSATLVPPLLAQASGLVLDVGPGSGTLIRHFDSAAKSISQVYGAEPSVELHPLLRKNAASTAIGRDGKYETLLADATGPSIARELKRAGVIDSLEDASEIFDTIVCIRVLCSVPDLDATIADLWKLLKPGGKLLVCEHTANPWRTAKGSMIARIMQSLYMLMGWSYFVGDCSLTRDIEDALRTGEKRWKRIELARYFGRAVFCYVAGVLVKES